MKLKVILKLAIKHLRVKKLRSIVTIGGMSLGVGVIVFLLSFGFGLQQLVTDQLVNLKSIDTVRVASQKSKILALDAKNMNFLKQLNNVKEVAGLYSIAGKMSFGGSTTDVVVYGTTNKYLDLSDNKASIGTVFTKDYNEKSLEAIVNTTALETIGIKDNLKNSLGKKVSLKVIPKIDGKEDPKNVKTVELSVVGVIDDRAGSFIYVHEEVLEKMGVNQYSEALVNAKTRESIPKIRELIENKGFTTISPLDTLNQINVVFQWFNIFLAALGTFGLAIAAGGMFNTLTVSLLERTREIGLMKILGARQKDIFRLFLSEAVIMTFAGGVLGIVLATILGTIINTYVNILASQRGADLVILFRIPPLFMLFIIGFSIVLGIVTSFYPARRGMKINPLQALKHE